MNAIFISKKIHFNALNQKFRNFGRYIFDFCFYFECKPRDFNVGWTGVLNYLK